ncbi:MAG: helix-turn-helix domain-containing protein [Tepidiformaceae bacterium]
MRLLADGLTDAEIAERLHLSIPAVRSRLHGFYDRSGIHGRAAVAWAKGHLGCCLAAPPNAA